MKRIFFTLFVFVNFNAAMYAQSSSETIGNKFTLGVMGGLNIPQLTGGGGNEMSRDYTSRLGAAFGFTATYALSSKFDLVVDALYSSEGGKRNGVQAIAASQINPLAPAGTYLYADYNNESIMNYAEIPVMLRYSIPVSKSSKFYINLGPYVGFLINARQKTSGSSPIYEDRAETIPVEPVAQSFNANTDVTSSIKTINAGFTGGIGITKKIGFGDIFIDVRGGYGLTIVQKDTQDGSSHIGSLLIAIGYSIPL